MQRVVVKGWRTRLQEQVDVALDAWRAAPDVVVGATFGGHVVRGVYLGRSIEEIEASDRLREAHRELQRWRTAAGDREAELARARERFRRYFAAKTGTPEDRAAYLALKREVRRRWIEQVRADPVRLAAHMELRREHAARGRERNREAINERKREARARAKAAGVRPDREALNARRARWVAELRADPVRWALELEKRKRYDAAFRMRKKAEGSGPA